MTGEPERRCLGVVQQSLNVCNQYMLPNYQIEGDHCHGLVLYYCLFGWITVNSSHRISWPITLLDCLNV